MARNPWPAIAINPTSETAADVNSLAAELQAIAGSVAAIEAEAGGHVERSGDSMTGPLGFPAGFEIRVYQNNPASGEDTLWIAPPAADGIDHVVIGPSAGVNYLKQLRLKADSLRAEGDGQVRLWIMSAADGGDIRFTDTAGNIVAQYEAGTGRWEFNTDLYADDGNTGLVEVFPKGTLIAMGEAHSGVDIANVSATEAELAATIQTIACDYASQPLYVSVTVDVVWKGMTAGTAYGVRPGVGGAAQGQQAIDAPAVTSTQSAGHTHSTPSHTHGWGTLNDTTSTDSGHFHGVGGGGGATASSSGTTGSQSASHDHDAVPTYLSQTRTWKGQASSNGSGNITFSIFGDGDAAADIDSWQISYEVWRR